jgi:hypothetical protein
VQLCAELKIDCFVLTKRATENYFKDDIVKRVLGQSFSALREFEKLENAARPWQKKQNWLLAREMSKEEVEATDLGQFIRKLAP